MTCLINFLEGKARYEDRTIRPRRAHDPVAPEPIREFDRLRLTKRGDRRQDFICIFRQLSR